MDLYGLLGYPLGHSFSAAYFTENSVTCRLMHAIATSSITPSKQP